MRPLPWLLGHSISCAIGRQSEFVRIAFLPLRMAQKLQAASRSPPAFARLVKAKIMHRQRLDQLDRPSLLAAKPWARGALSDVMSEQSDDVT